MILDPNNYLNNLNDFVKSLCSDFLTKIQALGYDILVKFPTVDSLAMSEKLHEQNPLNPIWNFHEFGIALDFNIVKDYELKTERIYLKNDPQDDWIKTGVPGLAKSLNIRWGGLFKGYSDCVHWDFANILVEKYKLNDVYQLIEKLEQLAHDQFGTDLTTAQLNKIVL